MFVSSKNLKKGVCECVVDGEGKENLLSFPQNLTIFTYVKFHSHSNAHGYLFMCVCVCVCVGCKWKGTVQIYSSDVLKTLFGLEMRWGMWDG